MLTWTIFRACLLLPWLGYLCWSDAKCRRLPNILTLGGFAAGVCVQAGFWGWSGVKDGLTAAGIAFLVLFIPFLCRGVGMGDVKLFAACGAFLGVRELPLFLVLVSFAGVVEAVIMLIMRRATALRLKHYLRCAFDWRYDRAAGRKDLPPASSERERIPYGIAIATGCIITVLLEFVTDFGG